ncbi:DUF2851 family protein [Polaribacter butkevichii]|uniref:DUF2851 domain-containing protein n=1 Tax=Polaribacter butkevichii TaxID=218490 RepID=A0A2P6C9I7_9FLAO|nr:DUF2851 family protein [Polaribacter butkevichii]PQJ69587.1 hypothetical protein BTO14_16435 [Polaribacter butkevichii]
MNEDFLHYVWQYQLFSIDDLKTATKDALSILKIGIHNHNSGPDFLNTQLKIDNQLWIGNVEIHLKSSDWYVHHHEVDENYDAVILHVVWEDDATVFMKNNKPLPVLVLKDFVFSNALNNYRNLFSSKPRWIPCEKEINTIDNFTVDNWKERLFFERLERKSNEMNQLLVENKNDYEVVLFQLLAKNFGLKVNGDAFLYLAKSFDFSVLRKVRDDEKQLTSLLFGQAGFLEDVVEEEYHQELKNEYKYLQHKYQLNAISKNQFSFFRMRPPNFPTIRIAQLISLYHLHANLFSKMMQTETLKEFYDLFEVSVNPFWKTHFTFDKVSKSSPKKLTKSFVDLLLINTIVPLKFLYQKNRGGVSENDFLDILQKIKTEKNSIISKFDEIGVSVKNAYESQALLELKNNYCAKKQCLQCAIGIKLVRK